jgi:hypothetical protein
MAYLGDIRENSISPEGIIWENDNRKDARYYWNGAFIDLCDLPGEDYAKTIFVTSGSGSNEPSTPSKQKNPITIQETEYMNENGEMFYAYKAVATQAVTSEVIIEMSVSNQFGDTEKVTIKIPVGSNDSEVVPTSTVKIDGVKRPEINTSKYSPLEDETFKYNTFLPEKPVILPMAYSITMLSGEIDTISDAKLIEMLIAKGEVAMKDKTSSEEFLVEFTPIAVEGFSNMTVPERKAVLKANVQDIIIVTDKPIKDIMLAGTPELILWTKRQGNVVIDNVTYDIWYKRDEGQIAQSRVYDPVTGELSYDNSVKYIIYYE